MPMRFNDDTPAHPGGRDMTDDPASIIQSTLYYAQLNFNNYKMQLNAT